MFYTVLNGVCPALFSKPSHFSHLLIDVCHLLPLLPNLGSLHKTLKTLKDEVIKKPFETCKLLVPATLYTIQNNLLFLALSNLDAATYQVSERLALFLLPFVCQTFKFTY